MKKLILVLGVVSFCCSVFFSEVQAKEVKPEPKKSVLIFSGLNADYLEYESSQFKVNSELNRAWVEADFSTPYSRGAESFGTSETLRAKVPGLGWDASRKSVIFESADLAETIVCADLVRSCFLFICSTNLKPTGRCEVRPSVYSERVDDGFEIHKRARLKVELAIY